jgi:hypothetical protein
MQQQVLMLRPQWQQLVFLLLLLVQVVVLLRVVEAGAVQVLLHCQVGLFDGPVV